MDLKNLRSEYTESLKEYYFELRHQKARLGTDSNDTNVEHFAALSLVYDLMNRHHPGNTTVH